MSKVAAISKKVSVNLSPDPYEEGKRAFRAGKNWNECPYAHMALSPHLYFWMCGWDDASVESVKGDSHVYLPANPVY